MKDLVERNHKKPISLLNLQKEIGLSFYYLSRIFKKVTGEKFIDYKIKEKIKKARKLLLRRPDSPVKQIASQVGYKDISYFTKVFKKITGMSPLHFRDSH